MKSLFLILILTAAGISNATISISKSKHSLEVNGGAERDYLEALIVCSSPGHVNAVHDYLSSLEATNLVRIDKLSNNEFRLSFQKVNEPKSDVYAYYINSGSGCSLIQRTWQD